jgi:hypothetical protein
VALGAVGGEEKCLLAPNAHRNFSFLVSLGQAGNTNVEAVTIENMKQERHCDSTVRWIKLFECNQSARPARANQPGLCDQSSLAQKGPCLHDCFLHVGSDQQIHGTQSSSRKIQATSHTTSLAPDPHGLRCVFERPLTFCRPG